MVRAHTSSTSRSYDKRTCFRTKLGFLHLLLEKALTTTHSLGLLLWIWAACHETRQQSLSSERLFLISTAQPHKWMKRGWSSRNPEPGHHWSLNFALWDQRSEHYCINWNEFKTHSLSLQKGNDWGLPLFLLGTSLSESSSFFLFPKSLVLTVTVALISCCATFMRS